MYVGEYFKNSLYVADLQFCERFPKVYCEITQDAALLILLCAYLREMDCYSSSLVKCVLPRRKAGTRVVNN